MLSGNLSELKYISLIHRQDRTKSIAHGNYVDFFSYTPNKDTVINVSAYTNAAFDGLVMIQIYCIDTTDNYINYLNSANIVSTANLTMQVEKEFKLKAGQECRVQIFQTNRELATKEFTINLFSSILWNAL